MVIGWSFIYDQYQNINTYKEFYEAVKEDAYANGKSIDHAMNVFLETKENDLFWTRDVDNYYWICKAKGGAEPYCDRKLDIGARIPVEAFRYGVEVPGQIKAVFNQKRGGIDVSAYQTYLQDGFYVYLFAPVYKNKLDDPRCIYIDRQDVLKFYEEFKIILPKSITQWENLFK